MNGFVLLIAACLYAAPPCEDRSACPVRVIPEYAKNDARRGRIRDVALRGIRVTGPECPLFKLGGCDRDHGISGITASGIYWNGREVLREVGERQQVYSFANPVRCAF